MARSSLSAFILTVVMSGCSVTLPPEGMDDGSTPGESVWREAFDANEAGFMSAVWGSGPDDVFVVGGQPEQGVIYHYDGEMWSEMNIPDVPLLVWVFGFSRDDVYAVGEQGGVLHFDGFSWSVLDAGTDIDLWGVWGASADDIWVVGGEIGEGPPVLLHTDGVQWTQVILPELDRAADALLKIWGTSSEQVFAVGRLGIILEFDGETWRQVASGTSEDLISLWGTGPDRIVAIGGRSNGVMAVYDGAEWTSRSVAPLPGLNGVFVEQSDTAEVVGLIGSAASIDIDSFEFTLADTPTVLTLHGVWGDGAGVLYAVGGRSSVQPFTGVVLERTAE